jgi:hypothetical protein
VIEMKEFLDYISTWSVLQWIVLVLIAGFIGQFGKMAAEAIARKIRARREIKQPLSSVDTKASVLPSPPLAGAGISDKKNLKALAKSRKKEAKKIK